MKIALPNLKKKITYSNKLAEEFVAFSNANGDIIIVGVSDNGDMVGLSGYKIRNLNQLISNFTNKNVKPWIYSLTEI